MTKFCKCGCGKETVKGRDYCWGHKTKNATRSITVSTAARDALAPKPNGEVKIDVDEAEETFTVNLTEPVMDALWGLLDGRKKAALLSKLGAE